MENLRLVRSISRVRTYTDGLIRTRRSLHIDGQLPIRTHTMNNHALTLSTPKIRHPLSVMKQVIPIIHRAYNYPLLII